MTSALKPKKVSAKFISRIKKNSMAIFPFNYSPMPFNYGNIGVRFSNACRQMFFFFIPALRDQIIGPTLGDACINYSWSSTTPYFKFTQALSKINYLLYAFYFLAPLCQSMPNIVISMRKGTTEAGGILYY